MVCANYCDDATLPLLIYIEDNGYGISVPSDYQTPGKDIAANLASFSGLTIFNGDGTDPVEASQLIHEAVAHVRAKRAPALLRLTVPRLEGHSFQDTQTYKSRGGSRGRVGARPAAQAQGSLREAPDRRRGLGRPRARGRMAGRSGARRSRGAGHLVAREGHEPTSSSKARCSRSAAAPGSSLDGTTDQPAPEGQRINMVTAIRRVLDQELEANPRVLVFGEDVGPKGGVHAVTLGLQEKFGRDRVFDTTLNEEGIVGRAVGMALAGLMPVPEIQFRKYAEPATEQIHDCGTMRWRTNNRFAAPMVLRVPGGFFKCGDPWHSMTNEVEFVHNPGWKVAVPSNAEDAVGPAARQPARQRPGAVLRASRDARRQLGAAAVAGR